jgi:hypothetical protein
MPPEMGKNGSSIPIALALSSAFTAAQGLLCYSHYDTHTDNITLRWISVGDSNRCPYRDYPHTGGAALPMDRP